MKQDVQNLRNRTEERISFPEDTVHPLSALVRTTTDELVTLQAKLDDLENCSSRNNLCCVGFPELFGKDLALNSFSTPGYRMFLPMMKLHPLLLSNGHTSPLHALLLQEPLHAPSLHKLLISKIKSPFYVLPGKKGCSNRMTIPSLSIPTSRPKSKTTAPHSWP